MPEATTDKKKAKRAEDSSTDLPSVKRARTATTPTPTPELILDLEKQISNSTEHYNNLVYLLQYMKVCIVCINFLFLSAKYVLLTFM